MALIDAILASERLEAIDAVRGVHCPDRRMGEAVAMAPAGSRRGTRKAILTRPPQRLVRRP
jgi:hypothetical protein